MEKKATSELVRFFFFAGLEGTGHHAMEQIYTECKSLGLCTSSDLLSRLIYTGRENPSGVFVYGVKGINETLIGSTRSIFIDAMKDEVAKHNEPKLVWLNTGGNNRKQSGEMSYPNFGSMYDSMQKYTDIFYICMSSA